MRLIHGDCLPVLSTLPDASVDAVVTDPPAGISFMGKEWDANKGGRGPWTNWLAGIMAEALRVARPGAYALVWALPRTSHWTATALDDAGWCIQDVITHHFGTGWPKHKSSLKPGSEHWILAYRPGKRALQVDACRIATTDTWRSWSSVESPGYRLHKREGIREPQPGGRWPANVIFSCPCPTEEHEAGCPVGELDRQGGVRTSSYRRPGILRSNRSGFTGPMPLLASDVTYADTGSASRFFYVAKASRRDRSCGGQVDNTHPTVKSTDLMRYLCRLVTPPGGTLLDPFAGSGSTLLAAHAEGFDAIGIEQDAASIAIATARLATLQPSLFAAAGE